MRAKKRLSPDAHRILSDLNGIVEEIYADGHWWEGARRNEVVAQVLFHWATRLRDYREAGLQAEREADETRDPEGTP